MDPGLPEQSFALDDNPFAADASRQYSWLRVPWPSIGFSVQVAGISFIPKVDPQEWALLSPKAVAKRRREFALGRSSAHYALQQIQVPWSPILKGKNNQPLWPPGVVGSISHTDQVAIAAVAQRSYYAGIGVDIELLDRKISPAIADRICLPSEKAWIAAGADPIIRLLIVFSAKESVFKALFPVDEIFLGFSDAELKWDADRQKFSGQLRRAAGANYPADYSFEVECRCHDDMVFTGMVLPAAQL